MSMKPESAPPEPADLSAGQLSRVWHITAWGFVSLLAPLGLLLLDVYTAYVNVAILYGIVLLLAWYVDPLSRVWRMTFLLIFLDFIGCIAKYHIYPTNLIEHEMRFRIINRTLLAISLLLMATLLTRTMSDTKLKRTQEIDDFESLLSSLEPLLATISGGIVALVIFTLDCTLSPTINLAILYSFPVVLIHWSRSIRAIWTLALTTAVLSFVGVFIGPTAANERLLHVVLTNRAICAGVVIGLACILSFLIGSKGHSSLADESWQH